MASVAVVIRIACLSLILATPVTSRAETTVPPLTARVTDLTGTLSADEVGALDQTLHGFEARRGTQIAVLIVASTAPETIEQLGIRVAEQWKVGRKNIDDGAILIVAKNDRTLRIEVGYGLESVLTDATSNRIINEFIVPRFREGDFYGGLTHGIDQMILVADGESLPPPSNAPSEAASFREYVPVLLLFAFVVGGFLRSVLGRIPGALVTGGLLGFLGWTVAGAITVAMLAGIIGFFFTLFAGGVSGMLMGRIGGRRFRGGNFSRGSGGGFRGGGGGFGGGGASGRW